MVGVAACQRASRSRRRCCNSVQRILTKQVLGRCWAACRILISRYGSDVSYPKYSGCRGLAGRHQDLQEG